MTPTEKQPAEMSDTPRTDEESLKRLPHARFHLPIDFARTLERELADLQKELPACIESAKRANLQNSEQLSVLSVLRRFPQLCLWYHESQKELAEKDKQIAALQSQLNFALDALERRWK